MTHAYPSFARSPAFADGVLVVSFPLVALLVPPPAARLLLLASIALVLAWGFATLHYPTAIDVDESGVAFHRYGRVHRFLWRDVTRVRVRRFVLRDRVLIRIQPAGPWRGRYWVDDRIDGFDALVTAFERRGRANGAIALTGT